MDKGSDETTMHDLRLHLHVVIGLGIVYLLCMLLIVKDHEWNDSIGSPMDGTLLRRNDSDCA